MFVSSMKQRKLVSFYTSYKQLIRNHVNFFFNQIELQSLHDEVFQLSLNWYNSLPTAQKKKIKEIYGISDMPIPDADIQAGKTKRVQKA